MYVSHCDPICIIQYTWSRDTHLRILCDPGISLSGSVPLFHCMSWIYGYEFPASSTQHTPAYIVHVWLMVDQTIPDHTLVWAQSLFMQETSVTRSVDSLGSYAGRYTCHCIWLFDQPSNIWHRLESGGRGLYIHSYISMILCNNVYSSC